MTDLQTAPPRPDTDLGPHLVPGCLVHASVPGPAGTHWALGHVIGPYPRDGGRSFVVELIDRPGQFYIRPRRELAGA